MANYKLPVEEELSKIHINKCKFPGWTTVALIPPEVFEVNKRAIKCVSNALPRLGEEREVGIYSSAACNEIADLINTQNSLVDKCIHASPLPQLSRALKIQNLATQCIILAKIIRRERYCLDKLKEIIYKDLAFLRFYLQ